MCPMETLKSYDFKNLWSSSDSNALSIARTVVGLRPNRRSRQHVYTDFEIHPVSLKLSLYNNDAGEHLRGSKVVCSPGLLYSFDSNIFGMSFDVFILPIRKEVDGEIVPVLRISDRLENTELLKKLKYQMRKEKLSFEIVDHHKMFPDI